MAVCAAYRMPHSVFLGWDRDDRDKAIWWQVRSSRACQQCGTRPEEWDPEEGGHRHAYKAVIESCRGCQVKGAAQRVLDSDQGSYRRGSFVALRPITR